MNKNAKRVLGLLFVCLIVCYNVVFAAEKSKVVQSLRLINNNHLPQKLLVVYTYSTAKFVKDLFKIVKTINEEENLPETERLVLHIISGAGNPISGLGISAEDAKKYVEVNSRFSSSDIWIQDCMELCAAKLEGDNKFVPAVFDSNRGRGLAGLPKTLADMWNLVYVKNPSNAQAHGDYGGNIEVTPFDDVLVIGNTVTPACKAFFNRMGYEGRQFNPDTRWLSVGHIDEYLSFIPTPYAPGGYSIVKADPNYALELVAAAEDKDFEQLNPREGAFLKRVKNVLRAQDRDPEAGRGTPEGNFIELNRKVADIIDRNVGGLKEFIRKVTNDPNRDFAEVAWPCLYTGYGGANPSGCYAYLPGVVNLLVLRNHLIVPACHFPPFDRTILARFKAQGNRVHFVDDEPYHNAMGEIHCGTNVLRHPEKVVLTKAQVEKVQRAKKVFRNLHDPNIH